MRGVYVDVMTISAHRAGSSPHARGLLRRRRDSPSWGGIIPACAGFTARVIATAGFRGDHPRMRGVYLRPAWGAQDSAGSSPHARGLPFLLALLAHDGGIIPARAGFTTPHPRRIRRGGDHPRTRGVYPDDSSVAQRHAGSSPHARGLQAPAGPARRVHRIIPARAGFTAIVSQARFMCEDHPRTRGVYRSTVSVNLVHAGSSPHTRGLRVGGQGVGAPARIIPAHAGFTCCSPGWRPGRTDHPRTRGVYVARRLARELAGGSSPHTRGLRVGGQGVGAPARIIPAHAGFTGA